MLLTDNGKETQVGAPYVSGAKVSAELVKEGRDKKISVIRYRQEEPLLQEARPPPTVRKSPHHRVAVTHKPDLWVLSSAFQSAFDGFGVGVFEFAPRRKAAAERRYPHIGRYDLPTFFPDADCRRVAFGIGGEGEDYFIETCFYAVGKGGEQLFDTQTVRFLRHERDGTAQDEVLSAECAAALQRREVGVGRDHRKGVVLSLGVGTNSAYFFFTAEIAHALGTLTDGTAERLHRVNEFTADGGERSAEEIGRSAPLAAGLFPEISQIARPVVQLGHSYD